MADRIHPSTKPPTIPPTSKPQLTIRPPYRRPQPPRRRRRSTRSLCCSLFLWLTLLLIALLFLAAIAAGVFYLLYHPHPPTFSLTSLRVSNLSLSSHRLHSLFLLSVSARNPNRKLSFHFDPIHISISGLAEGDVPGFEMGPGNVTLVRGVVEGEGREVGEEGERNLRKGGMEVEVGMETRVGVRVGGVRTKKVGIRVGCDGIKVSAPKGKKPVTDGGSCKVKIRVKIWKWYF